MTIQAVQRNAPCTILGSIQGDTRGTCGTIADTHPRETLRSIPVYAVATGRRNEQACQVLVCQVRVSSAIGSGVSVSSEDLVKVSSALGRGVSSVAL